MTMMMTLRPRSKGSYQDLSCQGVEYSEKLKIQALHDLGKTSFLSSLPRRNIHLVMIRKSWVHQQILIYMLKVSLKNGARFIVVTTGHVLDMSGLPKHPAALDIDVDNGKISGLF